MSSSLRKYKLNVILFMFNLIKCNLVFYSFMNIQLCLLWNVLVLGLFKTVVKCNIFKITSAIDLLIKLGIRQVISVSCLCLHLLHRENLINLFKQSIFVYYISSLNTYLFNIYNIACTTGKSIYWGYCCRQTAPRFLLSWIHK